MNANDPTTERILAGSDAREERIGEIVGKCSDLLNAGEWINFEEIVAAHPDLSPDLAVALEALCDFSHGRAPGSTPEVLGEYKIRRKIAEGGMGVVYEAWQESLDRRVALKILPGRLLRLVGALVRFEREAKAAGKLQHPNIVAVYDLGGIDTGTPYFVMEFVEGETLEEILHGLKPASQDRLRIHEEARLTAILECLEKRAPPFESISEPETGRAQLPSGIPTEAGSPDYCIRLAEIFAGVADALEHAHQNGVIHRDIKPSNLILDRAGRLRILDFGVALFQDEQGISEPGELVGTPAYMSPEQARGPSFLLDHRTDIYSLGATFYEMLTLRPPVQGSDREEILRGIVEAAPQPIRSINPRVPRDLERIVLKCLQKQRTDRYGTAKELADDLRLFAEGKALCAPSPAKSTKLVEEASSQAAYDPKLVGRLPLPLAQLYLRAHNAKTPFERHQTSYYLWESALKLLASVALVEYAKLKGNLPLSATPLAQRHEAELSGRLKNLARPTLAHWWEVVRRLVPFLAECGDQGFQGLRDEVLGSTREDLPRAASLNRMLCDALGLPPETGGAVRLTELFDRLVKYRNRQLQHGVAGQTAAEFYEKMGEALLAGVGEILEYVDVIAGRSLIYVEDVRRQRSLGPEGLPGAWLVELCELRGPEPQRLESLELGSDAESTLPEGRCLYLGQSTEKEAGAGEPPLALPVAVNGSFRSLQPLVLYEPETGEFFFLSTRRGQRLCEHVCYSSGRALVKEDLQVAHFNLLARTLGTSVNQRAFEKWAEAAQVEESAVAEPISVPIGRRVGDYELLGKLGHGGMAVVYRAWQVTLGRQVALKCLLRSGDAKAEARFTREVRALGRVEHPNLVKIFASGVEGDQWFYAMEILPGAPLAAVVQHLLGSPASELSEAAWMKAVSTACDEAREREESVNVGSRPLRPHHPPALSAPVKTAARTAETYISDIVEIIRQMALAAHTLHEAGVIHRDIKPGNIMVSPDGRHAVLMDLGLAQLADEAEGRLTRTRQFVGTLRYASPEQVLAVGKVDRRSDVYSLGATLWELLTLEPLFGATDETPIPELMSQIMTGDPAPPRRVNPRIPADLEAVVMKCLEKDPARRYGTAAELAEELGRFQRDEPVFAKPPTLRYLLWKYWRQHRLGIGGAAAVILAAVVFTGLFLFHTDRARREGRQQLAREFAATATSAVERGKDLTEALPYYARALELDPWQGEVHALRLSLALKQCARLRHAWFHDFPVYYAEFSQDGLYVLTSSGPEAGRGEARVYDAETGKWLASLENPTGGVRFARFSPDGKEVLIACYGGTLAAWECNDWRWETPALLWRTRHGDDVNHAAFSPDGTRVVSSSKDHSAVIRDARTGQPFPGVRPLEHKESVHHAEFSRDGKYVVTASNDETSKVWDAATGDLLRDLRGHTGEVRQASFSPDGLKVVTASYDGTARVWDWRTVPEKLPLSLPHPFGVRYASFSPDGQRVVTASGDPFGAAQPGQAVLWSAESGKPSFPPLIHGHRVHHTSFSPQGEGLFRIVTSSYDGTARVHDAATGEQLAPYLQHLGLVRYAFFSSDGRRVLTASFQDAGAGVVRVWEIETDRSARRKLGGGAALNVAAFGDKGRVVVTAGADRKVRMWDMENGELVREVEHPADVTFTAVAPDGSRALSLSKDNTLLVWGRGESPALCLRNQNHRTVLHAAFSRDGRYVAAASGGSLGLMGPGEVQIWDISTGKALLSSPLETKQCVRFASFGPSAEDVHLALALGDMQKLTSGEVQVLRSKAGVLEPVRRFSSGYPPSLVNCVEFSRDGLHVLIGTMNNQARLLDLSSGGELWLSRHGGPVSEVAFSESLALAVSTDTVQVLEATTGRTVSRLTPADRGPVDQAVFSPSGQLVATVSQGKVWVWHIAGQPISLFEGSGPVLRIAFRSDEEYLLALSKDGTIDGWDLRPSRIPYAELLRRAYLYSGKRVDETTRLAPIDMDTFKELWESHRQAE